MAFRFDRPDPALDPEYCDGLAPSEPFLVNCTECGYGSDDLDEWQVYFCPSEPDKCSGCELWDGRFQCPECMHEWEERR